MTPSCLRKEEILASKVQGFPVLHDQRVKGYYKLDMVRNVLQKTTEDLGFVENSSFIRGSTEEAVCRCSGISAHENTRDSVLLQ